MFLHMYVCVCVYMCVQRCVCGVHTDTGGANTALEQLKRVLKTTKLISAGKWVSFTNCKTNLTSKAAYA